MKKILIVDDSILFWLKKIKGLETKKELPKIESFDLTKGYHNSGGNPNNEIFILNDPISSKFGPNDIFYNLRPKKHKEMFGEYPKKIDENELEKQFEFKKIITKIKNFDYDILLVDMGITAKCPQEIVDEYSKKVKNKKSQLIEKTFSEIYFPPHKHTKKYMIEWKKRFPTDTRNENFSISYDLDNSGGVILGKFLKEEKIPFNFWTHDLGHARTNISIAYSLNLLSKEDIQSWFKNYKNSGNDSKSPCLSDSNNFIVYNKNILDRKYDKEDILEEKIIHEENPSFKKESIKGLETIIEKIS